MQKNERDFSARSMMKPLSIKHSQPSYYKIQRRFNKSKLPQPIVVLATFGIKPGHTNARGYWKICCPFHKEGNEKRSSFNMHQVEGYFRCHACGIKGSNILTFFMEMTGKNFLDAAKTLGAWED